MLIYQSCGAFKCFFVASLIHIPIGPSSAHLVLNGLVGVLLGWAAFPSIFVGLVLQALVFQFGGLTTLGVNTFAMAMPGVVVYFAFKNLLRKAEIPHLLVEYLLEHLQ